MTEAGVESAELCARMILKMTLALGDAEYLASGDRRLEEAEISAAQNLMNRRARGEPMSYLLGQKSFYASEFKVGPGVLSPRPETELLVELALEICSQNEITFADFCCGSGCVGLSVLAARPAWRGLLLDNETEALAWARLNAARLAPNAVLLLADIFKAPVKAESLDLALANPPYVAEKEIAEVEPGVLAWEPRSALFSGDDGLRHAKAVLTLAQNALKPGGKLIMEHGYKQRKPLLEFALSLEFIDPRVFDDLAGKPRVLIVTKK